MNTPARTLPPAETSFLDWGVYFTRAVPAEGVDDLRSHLEVRYPSVSPSRSCASAWASRRETCICDTPIRVAIWLWVSDSKKRITSTARRRGDSASISGRTHWRFSIRAKLPSRARERNGIATGLVVL